MQCLLLGALPILFFLTAASGVKLHACCFGCLTSHCEVAAQWHPAERPHASVAIKNANVASIVTTLQYAGLRSFVSNIPEWRLITHSQIHCQSHSWRRPTSPATAGHASGMPTHGRLGWGNTSCGTQDVPAAKSRRTGSCLSPKASWRNLLCREHNREKERVPHTFALVNAYTIASAASLWAWRRSATIVDFITSWSIWAEIRTHFTLQTAAT